MNDIIISLDTMGGDNAPYIIIEAASIVRRGDKTTKFVFFGNEKIIKPLISKYKNLKNNIEIVHTEEFISSKEIPSNAVRRGRKSSMALAIQSVKDGKTNAVVSAGNTGALMALSMFILRTMDGVRRPAICSSIPTLKGWSVMLDLGANIEADEENLAQFGIMGAVFHRIFSNKDKPTVGLLNVGTENMKGHNYIAEAGNILSGVGMIDYHGYVEGDDIGKGTVDVVVADGFSGNIALKAIEGTAILILGTVKKKMLHSVFGLLALFIGLPSFLGIKRDLDPARHNGAILLGLNGISVKSHGSASAKAFSTAIKLSVDLANRDFISQLKTELSKTNVANIQQLESKSEDK